MSHTPRLLFVDDEHLLHNLFERLFSRHGFDVTCSSSAVQAIDILAGESFDIVVTDFMMPDMDGFSLLSHIREHYPTTRVIMVTAHANVQHAVRMMQHGAIDYIPKPFTAAELVERVQKSLDTPLPEETAAAGKSRTQRGPGSAAQGSVDDMYVGQSGPIRRLKDMLPRVARNRAPVFIQGASGTGKEILARLIHNESDRASGPYLALNCANLPRDLVESHLFGHRKGAFTGAVEDMTGAFERADGGTLLLDEITEIDLPIQAKLLRVLQEQEVQKIGSAEVKKVDVRVVATSNRNLSQTIAEGLFREDLYHRLAVFPLTVPPLSERMDDVPLLTRHFAQKYCRLYGLPSKDISDALMQRLLEQDWPGNVRELENMIQRGVLLSADRPLVDVPDVYDSFFSDAGSSRSGQSDGASHHDTIEDMERHMILEALEESGNNQQKAADKLGISARTIRNKLKKYREEGYLT
ncbi:MAG: sigma-54-dependent Fis family transcriptional regulator [Bacteroidetes bacterium CG12_big_fil_rev_8_21_14_0_65_60_17]|nr:MAG: sigma-54-dependent Fis family transcriptional regulator [Bacteroidetes bacterium CG12_big_fil_rev_8_21_14_0_65_60_17]